MLSVFLEDEWIPALEDRLGLIRLTPKQIALPEGEGSQLLSALVARYPEAHCVTSTAACLPGSIDLLMAPLLLPWCADWAGTFAEWRRVLRPEGVLMVTALGPDTLREIPEKACGPVLIDMHDLGDALVQAGFQGPVLDVEHLTLRYRDTEKCLAEMQQAGMLSVDSEVMPFRQGEDGCVSLSIEMIYAHAFCPVSRKNPHEVAVSVDKIPRRY